MGPHRHMALFPLLLVVGQLVALLQPGSASIFSKELYGQGDADVKPLYEAWSNAYRATRDDVTVVYDVQAAEQALDNILSGQNDFINLNAAVDSSDPDSIEQYGSMFQVPIAAQGLAFTYNLPTLNASTDPLLVLDLKALADIFMGNITVWSDPYLATLNPELALANKLPTLNITMAFIAGDGLDISEPLKRALLPYNDALGPAIDAANGDFSGLPPALNGHAHAIADQAERLNFVRATEGALTYLGSADALRANLVCASLVNKANNTIALSTKSVAAAVADFAQEINAGTVVDILDTPGTESYPLAYISFISIPNNLTSPDCSLVTDLLTFFSWTQTNQGDGGRKHLIDTLAEVECNGEQAFELAILIGVGAPLAEFAIWATDYSNDDDDDKLHYYFADTEDAVQEASLEQVDYSITTVGLNTTAVPDLTILPAAAIAVVPAYNLPSLSGLDQPLVLNLSVIAEIYLGSVTRWNDPKIVELNADLLAAQPAALPDQEIMVLVLSEPSDITELFTHALSVAVDGWDDTVGVGRQVRFPVQDLANRTANVTAVDLAQKLKTTLYSFTFWTPFQVIATRAANMASLVNADNNVVAASQDTVTAAIGDSFVLNPASEMAFMPLILAPGEHSWPIVAWASFLLHAEQSNCNKLRGLVEFVYWTQTSETADVDLSRTYGVSANQIEATKTYVFTQLEALKCDGEFVVPFQHCLINGTLCSNEGLCSDELGTCICESGYSGVHCETIITSSSADNLAIGLGVGLPVGLLVLLVLLLLAVVVVVLARRRKDGRDDWEIDLDHELELGTVLGTGGFGEVYRATWKGTEVAVKKMVLASSDRSTKEMEKNFRDEVRVMTALRHPNVVLFMAACTKAPNMCIVMEYMGLGSLFELLHNELVPEIPTELRYKMAYQAAKGMHFLHSSGIVHRDLKSLNLLLDNKWNVKVSDFGLTKFKEDLKKTGGAQQQVQGSIHWTAPEILNEVDSVDHILADVYSFGIVLWEMLTREQPYYGMSPAAVAVAVIRDSLRPEIPEDADHTDFADLITTCWHQDPSIRPTFLEIMTRLSSMLGDSSGLGTKTSTNSSSSSSGKADWSLPSTSMATRTTTSQSASSSTSSGSSSDQLNNPPGASTGLRPPSGDDVTIVFTDIARAASLWEFDPRAMRDATLLHNALLRSLLKEHKGYEAAFIRDRNSGEGSFCMAFHNVRDALAWCADAQQRLLLVDWPPALVDHPGAAEEWGHTDDRVVFKGLRVRMGVNAGAARAVKDAMTRRVEYVGPTVNAAARITALTHGGQVLLSQSAYDKLAAGGGLGERWRNNFTCLGRFEVPDQASGARLYEFKVEGLEARFFGGVASGLNNRRSEPSEDGEEQEESAEPTSDSAGSGPLSQPGDTIRRNETVQSVVGEGMMFKEDNFLTSANLCRWIIDFKEIQLGKQVGMGSYGMVFRGRWKGVDVAVKRFIKQKLDERSMLEFRAEMAFLSELHHPNIVLFIGSCVKAPNLCIVTEFVKLGSLRELLHNTSGVKLEWLRRMRMLRSAALGINYLHSLRPVIVHRDLKSSNLLVDENWNVKVADFGFARIKEENATMTRCGTPCWTAPEIIRGESYSEKADVYSFAIIMWEVVTRKQPFAGLNFMGVSLDVLEGKRPQVPADCPRDVAKLMAKCWHDKPAKRPSMEDVVAFFDRLVEASSPGSGDAELGSP